MVIARQVAMNKNRSPVYEYIRFTQYGSDAGDINPEKPQGARMWTFSLTGDHSGRAKHGGDAASAMF